MALIKKKNEGEVVLVDQRKRERDCLSLVQQLADSNPVARRWAVKDLIECPGASEALVDQLEREKDPTVREVMLTVLTRLGDAPAVAGLVQFLRSEEPSLRNEAVEALKLLPDAASGIMGHLLTDPDPDVRIFAVNVLESLRHESVEHWLKQVIETDPHVNVCATAVDLLGEVGTSFSAQALEQLKGRFPDDPYIRFAADLALKRISSN